ncbi:hypothetical protein C1I98_19775 [Spongiactinospora gelatinilytica]|uniref:Uncharacterized protein n=1 Tax=Spongiactinospora gelatinilytica TaxID=2666298 RepID=A0A2W2H8A3_9ACTN|nr:hypothetical protein [Spongiactinospora gelatinilytica]PZG42467.1 hypothetical protein C1I98_19775 [Spongiactinospora gelatinilytica]
MSAGALLVLLVALSIATPSFLAYRHARRDETSVPAIVARSWKQSRAAVTHLAATMRSAARAAARDGAQGAAALTPPDPARPPAPAGPQPPEPAREKTGAVPPPGNQTTRPPSTLPPMTDAQTAPALPAAPAGSGASYGAPAAGAMFALVTAIADSLASLSLIRHGRDIRNPVAHLLAYATLLSHVATSMQAVHNRMIDARHDPMVLDAFTAMQAAAYGASLQGTQAAQTAINRYRGAIEDAAHPRLNDD